MEDLKFELELSYDFGSIANSEKYFEAFGKEIKDSLINQIKEKGRLAISVVRRKISRIKITNYGEIIFRDCFFKSGDAVIYPDSNALWDRAPEKFKVFICLDEEKFTETLNLRRARESNYIVYVNGIEPWKIKNLIATIEIKGLLLVIWINPNNWDNLKLFSYSRKLKKLQSILYRLDIDPDEREPSQKRDENFMKAIIEENKTLGKQIERLQSEMRDTIEKHKTLGKQVERLQSEMSDIIEVSRRQQKEIDFLLRNQKN